MRNKKKNDMSTKYIRAIMAMLTIAIIAGCENKTGDGDVQAQAEAPPATQTETPAPKAPDTGAANGVPRDTYVPEGLDGATVTIKPLGKALITMISGYPVRMHERASDGEYRQAKLKPGDYVLHVGNIEARQGLNLNFHGQPGDYYALALIYAVEGELFWTPVIVSGAPNGPIVADKDGRLVGKTQAGAIALMSASSNQPAQNPQAEAAAKQESAEEKAQRKEAVLAAEAEAKALFEKGASAFKAGQMEESLQSLDEALMIAPNFDSALALRGVALARLKKPKAALDSLDRAIRIGRNNRGSNDEWLHWPLLEKGLILLAVRKPALANEALSDSIRAKPTAKALAARANLSFALGQALGNKDDWDGAEPFFKSAQADAEEGIELAPESVNLWSIKTGTHIMLNEHEQACSAMRKACELGNCSILEQYPQCKPGGS